MGGRRIGCTTIGMIGNAYKQFMYEVDGSPYGWVLKEAMWVCYNHKLEKTKLRMKDRDIALRTRWLALEFKSDLG